jgi:metal-responsive CopG/Arc/MetJ family transcriptional regulator
MRTSVSLNDELASYVGEVSSSAGENNAEAIREAIRHAKAQDERIAELEATIDELRDELDTTQNELDDCQQQVERLQNEKRLILAERDEKQQLVKYVEQERTVEQRWREAGLTTQIKWRLFGMPSDAADDEQPD